jgi:ribosomal protein L23
MNFEEYVAKRAGKRGKARRSLMGRMARSNEKGRRASFKKAVVQLAEGDHIELYEVG